MNAYQIPPLYLDYTMCSIASVKKGVEAISFSLTLSPGNWRRTESSMRYKASVGGNIKLSYQNPWRGLKSYARLRILRYLLDWKMCYLRRKYCTKIRKETPRSFLILPLLLHCKVCLDNTVTFSHTLIESKKKYLPMYRTLLPKNIRSFLRVRPKH